MKPIAALFDFDGVIMDTELQYTIFWNKMGEDYLHIDNFGPLIKGQTLTQLYDKYFAGMSQEQEEITKKLNQFEKEMAYEFLPGIVEFMTDLRRNGVKMAVVTSSNENKMQNVYCAHPEFKEMVDCILTSEMFTRSKPAPDCFLLGMEVFETTPGNTYVFEDSFHGLKAGTDSGATVIGLTTTNSREAIIDKANYVIDDFTGMTFDKLLTMN